MDTDELLQKAVSDSDLAAGGLLNTQQTDRYIQMVVDESAMLQQARVVRMRGPVMELDKIATTGRVSQLKSEGIAPTDLSAPAFGKVNLTSVEVITPFEITFEALEDSIERGNLEATIIESMSRQTSTDLEELAVLGDTTSSDDYLKGLDGWRKQATGGNMVSADGSVLDQTVLAQMYRALPDQYKRNHRDLRFYFGPAAIQDWNDSFADRPTAGGDAALTGALAPPYMGVPLVSVPVIPTDLAAVAPYAGTGAYSFGFLTLRRNLIFGVQRRVRIDRQRDVLAGVNIYVISTRLAVAFEEPEAVVVGINLGLGA
jgi:HK97 family phage major capsid protein